MGRSEDEAGAAAAEVASEAGEAIAVQVQVRFQLPADESVAGFGGSDGNLCGRSNPCVYLWQAFA